MKTTLFSAAFFICFVTSTQEYEPSLKNSIKNRGLKIGPQADAVFIKSGMFPFENAAPGIYKLHQDGMPCLVPDTKNITLIPNAAGKVFVPFRGNMPNRIRPVYRYQYNALKK